MSKLPVNLVQVTDVIFMDYFDRLSSVVDSILSLAFAVPIFATGTNATPVDSPGKSHRQRMT